MTAALVPARIEAALDTMTFPATAEDAIAAAPQKVTRTTLASPNITPGSATFYRSYDPGASGNARSVRIWLRTPAKATVQEFRFLKVTKQNVSSYNSPGTYAVTAVVPVVLSVPADETYSAAFDLRTTLVAGAAGETVIRTVSLLSADLDIEYNSMKGVKELGESMEDTGDGGYISLQSQTHQGENITPTTYLVIRPITGLPDDRKVRLKFNSEGRYKVARDRLGNDPVVSEVTEFPAGQESRLYLVGETKSQSRGGEQITMQISNDGSWLDGDSLKATVGQTQFQIDLQVFIPYNWVNIPLYPGVAAGDSRSFDPNLGGTFRIAQSGILNLYKEWVPEVPDRLIDEKKSAGITYHFAVGDVTNFNSGAKHSMDTAVSPSYIDAGATHSDSGIADVSGVGSTVIGSLSNDSQCTVRFEGSAAEPILPAAAPINWRINVIISKSDPLSPAFAMEGVHDGFPAYEIYINSKHPIFPVTKVLQWKPPLAADVWELVGDMDTNAGPSAGLIEQ